MEQRPIANLYVPDPERRYNIKLEVMREVGEGADSLSRYVRDAETKVSISQRVLSHRKSSTTACVNPTLPATIPNLSSTAEGRTARLSQRRILVSRKSIRR